MNENKISGGKVDDLSLQDIADKFDVPITKLKRELEKGIRVEREHTASKETAQEIAMDHLSEMPDYYTRLIKMEKTGLSKWAKKDVTEDIKPFIRVRLHENILIKGIK